MARVFATQQTKKRRTSVDIDATVDTVGLNVSGDQANLKTFIGAVKTFEVHREPMPNFREKLDAFQKMCDRHNGFLTSSIAVDKCLLSMVLIYFERARMKLIGYTKDRYFFYALFLAIEMEEDSLDGLTEIIHYILGQAPCTLNYGDRDDQIRDQRLWDQRLRPFYQGKDAFWTRLGHRAYVRFDDISAMSDRFPLAHGALSRSRAQRDLVNFCTF